MVSGAVVTAVTAVVGTLLGGLTSFATTYFTQHRLTHADRIHRELDRREDVYARFIEEASVLALDAFENPLDDPKKLIGMSALVGRIRLASSDLVLDRAETVVDFILDTYQHPGGSPLDLVTQAPREFMAPLTAFTRACREERERLLRGL